jgi:hypothetical protein
MKNSMSYKNCLIRGESFQLTQSSGWIPRYILTSLDVRNGRSYPPSHHDRLDQVFLAQHEANRFAIEDAMQWIDENRAVALLSR